MSSAGLRYVSVEVDFPAQTEGESDELRRLPRCLASSFKWILAAIPEVEYV